MRGGKDVYNRLYNVGGEMGFKTILSKSEENIDTAKSDEGLSVGKNGHQNDGREIRMR